MGLRPHRCGTEKQRKESLVEKIHPGKPLQRPGARLLLPAVGAALSHVLENEGKQIFGFRLSPEALEQLDKVMRHYLQTHVGLDLKSRRFAADICF